MDEVATLREELDSLGNDLGKMRGQIQKQKRCEKAPTRPGR
jgi:hypothetical protein